jgi:hypothetical protein
MPSAEEAAARAAVAGWLRLQADECGRHGSPLYVELLTRGAADVEAGGDLWALLRGHESDPPDSALALRLMGAANRLRLRDEEPQALASWEAFEEVVGRRYRALDELIGLPVQTNEVGRGAALLFGFAAVAAMFAAKPLRILELGASAGLNLNWDRYRYEGDGFAWGPADSPVRMVGRVIRGIDGKVGPQALVPAEVEVATREGCDAAPVDITTPAGRETLLAYVWPDQEARLTRLEAALALAAAHPIVVDAASAPDWAAAKLAEPAPGLATVVFHSVFIQYLSPEDQARLVATIAAAGERATAEAPLAWLRLEGTGEMEMAELRLTTWPGGEERFLARAGYHGDPVELLESAAG